MGNLILILLAIFVAMALLVVLGERFAKPIDPVRVGQLNRWLLVLVGLMLVLSIVQYYF